MKEGIWRGVVLSYKNIDTRSEIYSETLYAWEIFFMSAVSPMLIIILKACLLPPWFSFLQGTRKFGLQRVIHGEAPRLPGMQGEILHLADCPVSTVLNRAGKEPWPSRGVHLHWKAESMAGSSMKMSFFLPIYSLSLLIWLKIFRYSNLSQPLLRVNPNFNSIILFSLFSFSLSFWWMLFSSLLIKPLQFPKRNANISHYVSPVSS